MLTPDGPKVIEYNSRFGDPETQVVLPRLDTDFAQIVEAVAQERLSELSIQLKKEASACVVIASGGYPGSYPKGLEISGLDENGQAQGVTVYPRRHQAGGRQVPDKRRPGCWGSPPWARPWKRP